MKIKTTIHLSKECKDILKSSSIARGLSMSSIVETLINLDYNPALDLFPPIYTKETDDQLLKAIKHCHYPPLTDKDDILNYLDGVEADKQLPPIKCYNHCTFYETTCFTPFCSVTPNPESCIHLGLKPKV